MAPVYLGTRERAWRGFENRRPVGMQYSMQHLPNLPNLDFFLLVLITLGTFQRAIHGAHLVLSLPVRAQRIRLHYRWPDPER